MIMARGWLIPTPTDAITPGINGVMPRGVVMVTGTYPAIEATATPALIIPMTDIIATISASSRPSWLKVLESGG